MKIPCTFMRGGTSRGPYFIESDLPSAGIERDEALIKIMGAGHQLQVDGIGGGAAQTSKVAIISKSTREGADVDYLFAQVSVLEKKVDWSPNCGNMLSGVGPFALDQGLVKAFGDQSIVRIYNLNTKALIHASIQTPNAKVTYDGDTAIDGVPGTAAPVSLTFLDAAGSKTGALLPTKNPCDSIDGIEVTLVDYATPMMLLEASSLGLKGDETPDFIDENRELMTKIEALRLKAGVMMGLGDVTGRVIPKVAILSKPRKGGSITSRYLMPDKCHKSHAVTGALCISAALALKDTIASKLVTIDNLVTIEHPSGKIEVTLDKNTDGTLKSASLIRTARKLFDGHVYL